MEKLVDSFQSFLKLSLSCFSLYCSSGCSSWCEGLLASSGEAQDLVALELGVAVDDGLGQAPHGLPLGLQSAALF